MRYRLHLSRLMAFVAAAGFLLAGCATTSTSQKPTKFSSSAKDWNGIDSVEFVQDFKVEDYARLVVLPLDTSKTALPPKEENTFAPVVLVLKKSDDLFRSHVAEKLRGILDVTNQLGEPPPAGTLLVRGRIADMHPGSQAARYWGGFGAGSAWVKINGEVADPKSGAVFLKFEQQRIGAMGLFGGSYDALLSDCVESIGNDVGRMISVFKTR